MLDQSTIKRSVIGNTWLRLKVSHFIGVLSLSIALRVNVVAASDELTHDVAHIELARLVSVMSAHTFFARENALLSLVAVLDRNLGVLFLKLILLFLIHLAYLFLMLHVPVLSLLQLHLFIANKKTWVCKGTEKVKHDGQEAYRY